MSSKNNTYLDPRLVSILEQHGGDNLLDILGEQEECLKDHQKRVARMAMVVAREMGLSKEQEEAVYVAASLHDIGMQQFSFSPKISMPGQLKMMERFRKHPEIGAELVKNLTLSVPVDQIILQHHERLDGSGFPRGLREVLIESQIIAAVDILDGVYSIHASDPEKALMHACDEIKEMQHEGLLDAEVINLTIMLAKENKLDLAH